jgi:CheY-like chemotaxis protein
MRKVSVLLVEDNFINQVAAKGLLKMMDVDVTVANHGKEALSMIAAKNFQLVLMDLQMPVMDGFESTSRIRAMEDPYFKQVPIIAFSASYIVDSKEKANELGMTDVLDKPFTLEALKNKIRTYVYDSTGS